MKKRKRRGSHLRSEYDFSDGVRGKYAARLKDTIAVVLDPDITALYPNAEAVNTALRKLAGLPAKRKRAKS